MIYPRMIVPLIILGTLSASAQTGDWSAVRTTAVGQPLSVNTDTRTVHCPFYSASDTELVCRTQPRGIFHRAPQTTTFPRPEVREVWERPRVEYLRNEKRGMLIGAGAGLLIGIAMPAKWGTERAINGAAMALPGLLVGGLASFVVHHYQGKLIYRRPTP